MARQRPELDVRFRHSKLHHYLLADEDVLVAQRQHWAALGIPIAVGAAGLFVIVAANYFLPPSTLTDLLWWALLALAVWDALKWFEWRRNWMVATDKRVMVNHGLVNQGVAMFSLSRVPDLTYTRSTIGRLLGYGELKRESTGDSQTLHKLRFVEHPHDTYTTICAAIFELQDRMFRLDEDASEHQHRLEDGPPPHTPGLVITPGKGRRRSDFEDESAQDDSPPGVRIHYGVSRHHERDPWRQSADLSESTARDADTGPIPYRRPATDGSDGWRPTTNQRAGESRRGAEPDRDTEGDRDGHRDRDRDHENDPTREGDY